MNRDRSLGFKFISVTTLGWAVLANTAAFGEEPLASTDPALEPVVVNAHAYKLEDPSPAAKIQAPLIDLPISVDQVSEQLLEDRKVVSLDEAIDSVAGVRLIPGFPGATGYLVRGFFETYNTLVDGFRDNQGSMDPQGVERIDVLKGPPSVLFGAQSAGGVLNIVTKVPQPYRLLAADLTAGSYGERRATIDMNQPLGNGAILTRLNGTVENADNFRDFVSSSTRYLAPAVTFKLTNADTLMLKYSLDKFAYTYFSDFPLGAPNDSAFLQVPIQRSLSEPGLPQSHSFQRRASYEYTHDFGAGWKFRSALGYNDLDILHGLARAYYPVLLADDQTVSRRLEQGPQQTRAITAQEEIFGLFETGALRHSVVAGVEHYTEYYRYVDNFASIGNLNIFNPVYGDTPGPLTFGYAGESGDRNLGLYAQDLLSVGDHWKFLVGGREDRNASYYLGRDATGATTYRTDDTRSNFAPRLGAIYKTDPDTSLYSSWSKSFLPNIYYNAFDGSVLPPAHGDQIELGVKRDVLDRHVSLTAAAYRINRTNVPTPDPDPAHAGFSVVSGEQQSKGLELSAVGRIAPTWNLYATYAHTLARVTSDNLIPVGQRLAGVPTDAASVWTQYEISTGQLAGFGGGVGATYASAREATLPNTFRIDSYTRLDALAYYHFDQIYRIAFNLKNLNNVRYYDTDGGYALRPGAPRTILVTLRAEF